VLKVNSILDHETCMLNFCNLIYGDLSGFVCLVCSLCSNILLESYSATTQLPRKYLSRHYFNSWNTIDLKIISLFLSSFWFTSFISFFAAPYYFFARQRNYLISCFKICFYTCLLLLFSVVSSNVSRYSTRTKIPL